MLLIICAVIYAAALLLNVYIGSYLQNAYGMLG